jgi:hypothetical protein
VDEQAGIAHGWGAIGSGPMTRRYPYHRGSRAMLIGGMAKYVYRLA